MKIEQLLSEAGILQSFEKGLRDPYGGIKQALSPGGGTGYSPSSSGGTTKSPYDVVDNKKMIDILDKIIKGEKLEPYQIDILRNLQRSLIKNS